MAGMLYANANSKANYLILQRDTDVSRRCYNIHQNSFQRYMYKSAAAPITMYKGKGTRKFFFYKPNFKSCLLSTLRRRGSLKSFAKPDRELLKLVHRLLWPRRFPGAQVC